MPDGSLEQFITKVNGKSHLRVEADLGDGFVRLYSAEAERRQAIQDIRSSEDIIIELLRNARDSGAKNIFVASTKSAHVRRFVVIDDGSGIPVSMHEHIFEPRVTSKLDTMHMDTWGVHGRGMALYSISVNAQRAFVAASDKGLGSSIVVESDTRAIGEKADQSSFPKFIVDEERKVSVRGPKNILRTCCEFALNSLKTCTVYFGSEAEIASTLYQYGLHESNPIDLAFSAAGGTPAIVESLSCASDPQDFNQLAKKLGFQQSERTSRRILDGQVCPLKPLLSYVRFENEKGSKIPNVIQPNGAAVQQGSPDKSRISLSDADRQEFARSVQESFKPIAQSYYLDVGVEPEVSVRGGAIHVRIPLKPLD